MIFLTASAIGICAFLLRSPAAYLATAVLVTDCFAAAWFTAVGALSPMLLLLAFAGYNAGMATCFVTLLLVEGRTGRSWR